MAKSCLGYRFLYLCSRHVHAPRRGALKSTGYTWSYLACRIGPQIPIWQPIIGSSFQECSGHRSPLAIRLKRRHTPKPPSAKDCLGLGIMLGLLCLGFYLQVWTLFSFPEKLVLNLMWLSVYLSVCHVNARAESRQTAVNWQLRHW
jgi:hypothetical protein